MRESTNNASNKKQRNDTYPTPLFIFLSLVLFTFNLFLLNGVFRAQTYLSWVV